jgi:hypothetical protein
MDEPATAFAGDDLDVGGVHGGGVHTHQDLVAPRCGSSNLANLDVMDGSILTEHGCAHGVLLSRSTS